MNHKAVILVAGLALVAAGCSSGAGAGPGARSASPRSTGSETTVYFLTDQGSAPIGIRRRIASQVPFAAQALAELLAGPRGDERNRGVLSALPPGVRIRSLTLGGTEATIHLAGLPTPERASVLMRVRVLTQIARTVIGLSGIESVRVFAGGAPWDLPTMEGPIVSRPTGYGRLLGFTRICAGQRTEEERARGLSRCFSALP